MRLNASGKPRRRFLLIHNETAGLRRRTLVARTIAHLQQSGATVERYSGFDAFAHHRIPTLAEDFDAVIAAGGDGTIRAVATAVAGSAVPIGVIPQGTGNVLAHEIGLSRSPEHLAQVLIEGPVREITGGLANGQPFFLMAGAGFDGAVIQRLDAETKRRFGKAAYTWPVLTALMTVPPQLECHVDGDPAAANWVIVAKSRYYGGAFDLSPEAGLSQPYFLCFLISSHGALQTLARLGSLSLSRLASSHGVVVKRARHVTVRSEDRVPIQVDGDACGMTPLKVTYGGAALRLIVPKS